MSEIEELRARLAQTEVQLAGCGVAALGWSRDEPAKPGDYGWSESYADVLRLRSEVELLRKVAGEVRLLLAGGLSEGGRSRLVCMLGMAAGLPAAFRAPSLPSICQETDQ
jgi:hypothetical protein